MRNASIDLARGRVESALNAYEHAGMVRSAWTKDEAIGVLIEDWNRDYAPDRTSLILAHLRRGVRALNELARAKLVERGIVGDGFVFRTEGGTRHFAVSDRIVFLKNEGSIGVKNGMLAKVVDAALGRIIAEIGEGEDRRQVVVEQRLYANVDYGYATTVHKSQGATVDDVKVLASRSLDRHLIYVALTRHRDAAQLYVGLNEFTNCGGVLVDHGPAPYENKPENRDSYFVTLETGEGGQNTIWGVDLERAMAEAAPQIGDRLGLEHQGSELVRLPDGKDVERNSWKVVDVRELALRRLSERLSRDGSKETTLDHEGAAAYRAALRFADSRGLHIMNVAHRREWAIQQKERVGRLGTRLVAIAARFGLVSGARQQPLSSNVKKVRPMVAGVAFFPNPLDQAVEDKLSVDPTLKEQWEEVSARFHMVFAEPQAAFRAVDVDAMVKEPALAMSALDRTANDPLSFGALSGKTGILVGRADKQDRKTALVNAPALSRDLGRYLRMRENATQRIEAEERALRQRQSVDIPALSPAAASALEQVRHAIERGDLPAAVGCAMRDRQVREEVDRFSKAIADRFGERALLTNAAREPSGRVFETFARGLQPQEKERLKEAWPMMRTAQQLAAHERTAATLKQVEDLRLAQRQSPVRKQ